MDPAIAAASPGPARAPGTTTTVATTTTTTTTQEVVTRTVVRAGSGAGCGPHASVDPASPSDATARQKFLQSVDKYAACHGADSVRQWIKASEERIRNDLGADAPGPATPPPSLMRSPSAKPRESTAFDEWLAKRRYLMTGLDLPKPLSPTPSPSLGREFTSSSPAVRFQYKPMPIRLSCGTQTPGGGAIDDATGGGFDAAPADAPSTSPTSAADPRHPPHPGHGPEGAAGGGPGGGGGVGTGAIDMDTPSKSAPGMGGEGKDLSPGVVGAVGRDAPSPGSVKKSQLGSQGPPSAPVHQGNETVVMQPAQHAHARVADGDGVGIDAGSRVHVQYRAEHTSLRARAGRAPDTQAASAAPTPCHLATGGDPRLPASASGSPGRVGQAQQHPRHGYGPLWNPVGSPPFGTIPESLSPPRALRNLELSGRSRSKGPRPTVAPPPTPMQPYASHARGASAGGGNGGGGRIWSTPRQRGGMYTSSTVFLTPSEAGGATGDGIVSPSPRRIWTASTAVSTPRYRSCSACGEQKLCGSLSPPGLTPHQHHTHAHAHAAQETHVHPQQQPQQQQQQQQQQQRQPTASRSTVHARPLPTRAHTATHHPPQQQVITHLSRPYLSRTAAGRPLAAAHRAVPSAAVGVARTRLGTKKYVCKRPTGYVWQPPGKSPPRRR